MWYNDICIQVWINQTVETVDVRAHLLTKGGVNVIYLKQVRSGLVQSIKNTSNAGTDLPR